MFWPVLYMYFTVLWNHSTVKYYSLQGKLHSNNYISTTFIFNTRYLSTQNTLYAGICDSNINSCQSLDLLSDAPCGWMRKSVCVCFNCLKIQMLTVHSRCWFAIRGYGRHMPPRMKRTDKENQNTYLNTVYSTYTFSLQDFYLVPVHVRHPQRRVILETFRALTHVDVKTVPSCVHLWGTTDNEST